MRGHTPGTVYRRTDTIPYVEFWEQPLLRWLIARAYGLWERLSWRLIRKLEPLHQHYFDKGEEFYIPLTNRQDLRLDDLQRRSRRSLAFVYVTQEQYDVITGKAPHPSEIVRHEDKQPVTIEPEAQPQE